MKNRGLLLLFGLILSLVVSIQSQCIEDKYEPNNSIVQATPNVQNGTLVICVNGTTTGDWFGPYSVIIGQQATVRIDFNASEGNLDIILTSFDASTLASSQSTTKAFEEVVFTGALGRTQFYVNVLLRTDGGNPGIVYTYKVTFGPTPTCSDDPYEPNNNLSQPYPSPTTAIACMSNPDYYGPIDLVMGQNLSASLSFQDSQDVLSFELISETNQHLLNGTSITGGSYIDFTPPYPQTVFLLVKYVSSATGSVGSVYTVDWSLSQLQCEDNDYFEPNSLPQIPGPLPGAAVNLVACLDSSDYFGPVTLTTDSSFSLQLLYSAPGLLGIRLSDAHNSLPVTPTTYTASPSQLLVSFVNTKSQSVSIIVEVYVAEDPSAIGVKYSLFSITKISCTGINCPSGEECSNGTCVCLGGATRLDNGTCPDPCANVACPTGEHCSNGQCLCDKGARNDSGVCVVDLCLDVTCPSGEHCLNGLCECNNGTRNSSGVCVVDLCLNVTCPSGEHCLNGLCECNNGTRNSAGVCVVDPCLNVTCPSGEHCSNGQCVCNNGSRNSAGVCVVDLCLNVTCPSGEHCLNGLCECNNGTRNATGVCVVENCLNVTCPSGEHCSDGQCVCNNGSRNSAGVCVVDLCLNVTCPSGEHCLNGLCECNNGTRNASGVCVLDCSQIHCGANEYCENGSCLCSPGFVKVNNTCQLPNNCTGVICPENSSCQNGFCVCDTGFDNGSGGSTVPPSGVCHVIPCFDFACPQHATCNQNQCFCDHGYYNSQTGGASVPQNGVCAQDKCAFIECPAHSQCNDGACKCDFGYVQNSIGNCVVDPCASVVCSDPHAGCYNGLCFCADGYEQKGDQCVELPPDACYPTNCSSIGALCNSSTAKCQCDFGLEVSPYTGVCDYPVQDMCTFVTCPSNAHCSEGYCYCNTGYMEGKGGCIPANLGGCSEYRGFTDEVTVDLISQVALQNLIPPLNALEQDLDWVLRNLPEWEQNECCPSSPYVYPFDMADIAEAAWQFLVDPECSLDRYDESSQQYYQNVKY